MFLLRKFVMSKPVFIPLKNKSAQAPKPGGAKSTKPKSKEMKANRPGLLSVPHSHRIPCRGNAFRSLWERRRLRMHADEKSKGLRLRDEIPSSISDADAISSMSDGISPWSTYNITLKGFSTLTVNGSGVLAISIPADPSSAGYNFAEYSDLSAIFTEVRILALSIQAAPIIDNATALTAGTPVLVGFNPNVSSAPASEGAVASLIYSTYWNAGADRSSRGSIFHTNYDTRLDFSLTSSVTVTPYAGCPGSYQLYGSGYPNGSVIGKVLVLGLYQFRGRS
jgi:hypothetical protein